MLYVYLMISFGRIEQDVVCVLRMQL